MADQVATYNELVLLDPPERALLNWETGFSPLMADGGWHQTGRTADAIVYTRRWYPGWVIVVCILAFPLGLLALLAEKNQATLAASFSAYGSGTMVKLSGNVPQKSKVWLDGFAQTLNDKARAATSTEEVG